MPETETASLPRFFVGFVSHFNSSSLMIPPSYYDELPSRLPENVTLQGTGGCFWKTVIMRKLDGVYFEQGWSKFVEDNQLKDGDILTFIYDGDRTFEVSIYGQGGCKDIRAIAEVVDVSEEDSVCSLTSNDTNSSSEPEIAAKSTVERSRDNGKSRVVDDDDDDDDDDEDSDSEDSNSESDDIEDLTNLTNSNVTSSKKRGKSKAVVVEDSDEEEDSDDADYSESDCSYTPDDIEHITTLTKQNSKKRGKAKSVTSVDNASCSVAKRTRKLKPKIKNPERYLKDPNNIHFETCVKNRNNELLVNAQLVKDYGLKFDENIAYIYGHKKLEGKASKWGDRVCIKNWKLMCKRLKLEQEDRVLCELLRRQNVVYAIELHVVREKDL